LYASAVPTALASARRPYVTLMRSVARHWSPNASDAVCTSATMSRVENDRENDAGRFACTSAIELYVNVPRPFAPSLCESLSSRASAVRRHRCRLFNEFHDV